MTVTDQIKILNRKITQNEAQYDLDRKAARISASSSNNLDKYEYLSGEKVGLKPSTTVLFEYSPLGKSFNKSQEDKDLMDEIEDANDNIDDGKLLFIGSNKENLTLTLLINH